VCGAAGSGLGLSGVAALLGLWLLRRRASSGS